MSADYDTFRDYKLVRIINETISIGIAQTRDLRYTIPDNFFVELTHLSLISALASNTINNSLIDGQEITTLSPSTSGTSVIYYHQAIGTWSTTAPTSRSSVPMRRHFLLNVTNVNAAANNLTIRVNGFVHKDLLKEFQRESTFSPILATL